MLLVDDARADIVASTTHSAQDKINVDEQAQGTVTAIQTILQVTKLKQNIY